MTQSAVLGGGCFWCLEAAFSEIKGVLKVEPGYAGGTLANPSYDAVSAGHSGHAEVVRLEFDTDIISYEDILDIFWAIHDPTTLNRQGNDIGTQYRSIILTTSSDQIAQATKSKQLKAELWADPIVTEIKPLDHFYAAEAYHHNYFINNPDAAYCQIVINPKLAKLRQKFQKLLK